MSKNFKVICGTHLKKSRLVKEKSIFGIAVAKKDQIGLTADYDTTTTAAGLSQNSNRIRFLHFFNFMPFVSYFSSSLKFAI